MLTNNVATLLYLTILKSKNVCSQKFLEELANRLAMHASIAEFEGIPLSTSKVEIDKLIVGFLNTKNKSAPAWQCLCKQSKKLMKAFLEKINSPQFDPQHANHYMSFLSFCGTGNIWYHRTILMKSLTMFKGQELYLGNSLVFQMGKIGVVDGTLLSVVQENFVKLMEDYYTTLEKVYGEKTNALSSQEERIVVLGAKVNTQFLKLSRERTVEGEDELWVAVCEILIKTLWGYAATIWTHQKYLKLEYDVKEINMAINVVQEAFSLIKKRCVLSSGTVEMVTQINLLFKENSIPCILELPPHEISKKRSKLEACLLTLFSDNPIMLVPQDEEYPVAGILKKDGKAVVINWKHDYFEDDKRYNTFIELRRHFLSKRKAGFIEVNYHNYCKANPKSTMPYLKTIFKDYLP